MTALLCKYRHFESSKPLKLSICNLQPRIFNQIESKATHYSAFFRFMNKREYRILHHKEVGFAAILGGADGEVEPESAVAVSLQQ